MLYVLVLVIGYGQYPAMTNIPGFSDRGACDSAGQAFLLEAKAADHRPRYYCFASHERSGSR
jgi:hypothetical protein